MVRKKQYDTDDGCDHQRQGVAPPHFPYCFFPNLNMQSMHPISGKDPSIGHGDIIIIIVLIFVL